MYAYTRVCVCVCTFAVSPNRGTLRNGGQQTGRAWHHSNASSHVHVYRTDFVRNETATFIVIIWLRVARNCSAESRIPVQIPGNFLEKEKENSRFDVNCESICAICVVEKKKNWESMIFRTAIQMIIAYYRLREIYSFFLKNWNDKKRLSRGKIKRLLLCKRKNRCWWIV